MKNRVLIFVKKLSGFCGKQYHVMSLKCLFHAWHVSVLNKGSVLGSRLWKSHCSAVIRIFFFFLLES